jgi:hypothetical protein
MTASNFNYSFYTLSATCCLLLFELHLRQVKNIFLSVPHLFLFHSLPPFPYLFFIHPIFLSSSFSICSPIPHWSLPPSHFCYIHSTCPLNCVSLLIPMSAIFLSTFFSCRQVLFSFFLHSLYPRYSGISSDSFPSFLLVCIFVPFTQLYIHPSSFCS